MTRLEHLDKYFDKISDYVEAVKEETPNFYEPSLKKLEELRLQAASIMMGLNDVLAQFDRDDPKFIVKSQSDVLSESFENRFAELDSKLALIIQNQVAQVNQQSVNVIVNGATVAEPTIVPYVEPKEEPEYIEPKVIAQSCDNSSTKQPNVKFIPTFKSVIEQTTLNTDFMYSVDTVHDCGILVDKYFQTRFDIENDPFKKHKFTQKDMKNYLYSIVLGYSKAVIEQKVDDFKFQFYEFINKVKEEHINYTLPISCAEIFFDYIKTPKIELPQKVIDLAATIWSDLWLYGYSQFLTYKSDYDSIFLPKEMPKWALTADLSRFNGLSLTELGSDKYASIIDDHCVDLSSAKSIKELWSSYLLYRRIMGVTVNQLVSNTIYEEKFKSSDLQEVCEMFVFNILLNANSQKSLQSHIKWFGEVIQYIRDNKVKTVNFESMLKTVSPESLDLFELM